MSFNTSNNSIVGAAALPFNVYIPRMSKRFTERHVMDILSFRRIGIVSSVDFVELNTDKLDEQKAAQAKHFVSAFIQFAFIERQIQEGIMRDGKIHVYVNTVDEPNEFWMLLPSKTTIPRTILNIHQVAAYTDEAYTKITALETTVAELKAELAVVRAEKNTADNEQENRIAEKVAEILMAKQRGSPVPSSSSSVTYRDMQCRAQWTELMCNNH